MDTKKSAVSKILIIASGLFASSLSNAWHGNYHGHNGGGYYNRGGGYYHGHGGYFGGGYWGWGGPNVIINVPVERYYAPPPRCETVRVCNEFDECWLERDCY